MAAHSKEDSYYIVTPLSGKLMSVSVFREVGPRILTSICQWLGDKSKISTSPFAGENYILAKTVILLLDDKNVLLGNRSIQEVSSL